MRFAGVVRRALRAAIEILPRQVLGHRVDELTEREREVFRLIARGHSNAEIGRERYISDTTIKDAHPPEAQPS